MWWCWVCVFLLWDVLCCGGGLCGNWFWWCRVLWCFWIVWFWCFWELLDVIGVCVWVLWLSFWLCRGWLESCWCLIVWFYVLYLFWVWWWVFGRFLVIVCFWLLLILFWFWLVGWCGCWYGVVGCISLCCFRYGLVFCFIFLWWCEWFVWWCLMVVCWVNCCWDRLCCWVVEIVILYCCKCDIWLLLCLEDCVYVLEFGK